jgi:hypothetical protein
MRTVALRVALVVALVGLILTGSPPVAQAAQKTTIANDTVWRDTAGNEIKAQGGSILKVGSTWYWAGTQLDDGKTGFKAVNLYSSSDLTNWTFVRAILSPTASGDLATGAWVGRPDLVYNPSTAQFVLVMEINGGHPNKLGFATSSSVSGPYTYLGSSSVNGGTFGDHSVFVDGANAYLVYDADSGGYAGVQLTIAPLAADWLSVLSPVYTEYDNSHEAPFIMKKGSSYIFFQSGRDWWAASETRYKVGSSLTNWGAWSAVPTSPPSNDSFNTQNDFIIPVTGSAGTSYIYAGDRYSNFYGAGHPAPTGTGRNAWYPVTFNGNVPTINGATDLYVDVATGTLKWNRVTDGRFDMYGTGQTPGYWNEATNVDASFTQDGGFDGAMLTHWSDAAYSVVTYQTVSLPNGTYKLSALVRSSGGQPGAALYVKDYGGAEVDVSLASSIPTWTDKSVTFTVTTGKVEIGVWSYASANQWLNLDYVNIWPS